MSLLDLSSDQRLALTPEEFREVLQEMDGISQARIHGWLYEVRLFSYQSVTRPPVSRPAKVIIGDEQRLLKIQTLFVVLMEVLYEGQ